MAEGTAVAVVLLLMSAGGVPARAAPITLVSDMPGGENWANGVRWSDGQPAGPGNDYLVGSGAGKILRSPENAATATFPGDSLQLDPVRFNGCLGAVADNARERLTEAFA